MPGLLGSKDGQMLPLQEVDIGGLLPCM